jgi:serine/threonine protein kinase
MGSVWLAFDRHAGVQVAVKTLTGPALSGADQERARRNFLLVRQLTHPNVVALRQLEIGPHGYLIVMDFIEGCDLEVYTRTRGGVLGLGEVLWVVQQTARGLDYAAGLRIVHRDVKPANLLLGSGSRLLIGDFGIATLATAGGQPAATLHLQAGTPLYMAPEQWVGAELDGRADQYALAAVAYRLLSGVPPFYDRELGRIDPRVFGSPPATLPQLRRRQNAALLKALEARPEDRFESCEELFHALSKRSGWVPVAIDLTRPQRPDTALRRSPGRRRTGLRLAMWTALAAAVVVGALALGLGRGDPPPEPPPKPPEEPVILPVPQPTLPPPAIVETPPSRTSRDEGVAQDPPLRQAPPPRRTPTPPEPATRRETPPTQPTPEPDPRRFEDLLQNMPRIGEQE